MEVGDSQYCLVAVIGAERERMQKNTWCNPTFPPLATAGGRSSRGQTHKCGAVGVVVMGWWWCLLRWGQSLRPQCHRRMLLSLPPRPFKKM